jgi:hypothetical protein
VKLKNNRISSMLNNSKNNKDLALLLEAGLLDNSKSLKLVLNKTKQILN